MDGKSKLTKEVVAQEARFILDSLISAGQFSKEVQFEELRRLCEQSVSLRLLDYLNFLERFGYLTYDRNLHQVSITPDGERVVGGEKVAELVIDVVHHFRPILSRSRTKSESYPPSQKQKRQRRVKSNKKELIDQRYEKIKLIGSGGIGTVYLARQVMLDREVAIKEIRELFGFFTEPQRQEIIKRFDSETRLIARLSHPNIVTILDGNTNQEFPYVVSEFVSGGSLRHIIKLAEEIPPKLSVKVFLQLLHALGHSHKHDVVHRGLKPENILFDSTGNVRVTDFGLSRVVERDQAVIQHVYVGIGSVAYMAPELFNNPQKIGPRSDLYALGIILYEMLARKLPGRRSPMPTNLFPELPKVLDDIFDKLTQDEPEDRYGSVDEVLEDFHKADASKDFIEPRGAMLFLDNPLSKLTLKAEENPIDTLSSSSESSSESDVIESLSSLGLSKESLSKPKTDSEPIYEHAATSPLPVLPSEEEILPEIPNMTSVSGVEELSDEDGDRSKRRKSRRPYSFQQRMKDRDK